MEYRNVEPSTRGEAEQTQSDDYFNWSPIYYNYVSHILINLKWSKSTNRRWTNHRHVSNQPSPLCGENGIQLGEHRHIFLNVLSFKENQMSSIIKILAILKLRKEKKPLVADLQSSSDLSHPSKARDNNGEIWEL